MQIKKWSVIIGNTGLYSLVSKSFFLTSLLPSNVSTPVLRQASAPTPEDSTKFSISFPIFGNSFKILPTLLLLFLRSNRSSSIFFLHSLTDFLLSDRILFLNQLFTLPFNGSCSSFQFTGSLSNCHQKL